MKKSDLENLNQLKKEVEEWRGKYLRALADYQNLEKRILAQRKEEIESASKNLILKILPIVDVLEKAEEVLKDQGLHLAMQQLRDVLAGEGLVKIEVMGKKFDPNFMECVEVIEGEKEDEVIEEFRPGYTLKGKVIRVAQVKVGKKKQEKKAEDFAQQEESKKSHDG